jgi:hypothetical protein
MHLLYPSWQRLVICWGAHAAHLQLVSIYLCNLIRTKHIFSPKDARPPVTGRADSRAWRRSLPAREAPADERLPAPRSSSLNRRARACRRLLDVRYRRRRLAEANSFRGTRRTAASPLRACPIVRSRAADRCRCRALPSIERPQLAPQRTREAR